MEVATKGGRERWRAENEGFNTQKNSGLNLEHAYSHTCWAAYYFLLQIAHLLLQLVEKGSLLRRLAQEQGKRTAVELFGSLKNMAQRLLESLRYRHWPDEVFDRTGCRRDPDPLGYQLAAGGGWGCSRFSRVLQGLVAVELEAAFEPAPLRPFPARAGPPALAPPTRPRPKGEFLRAGRYPPPFSSALRTRYDVRDLVDSIPPAARNPDPTMNTRSWPYVAALLVAWATPCSSFSADDKATVPPDHARRMQEGLALFKAKVRPALERHCLDCHGGKATKGDLDLSDRKPLVEERRDRRRRQGEPARRADQARGRAAHAPEGPEAPRRRRSLISAAGSTSERPMTGRSSIGPRRAKPATGRATERAADFWSFRPLATVAPSRRARRGLGPHADRSVHPRRARAPRPAAEPDRRPPDADPPRLSFDLTGLPPSPEEVDAFVGDPSPDAYERLVDRLLASPITASGSPGTGWTWRGSPSRTATSRITIGRSRTTTATS